MLAHRLERSAADDAGPFSRIIGASPGIAAARNIARRAARGDSNVLLVGETGTGKELFAKAIHLASGRASGPFVAVNCAAIPETLIESELFGHEHGSFTGARPDGKKGMFEVASSGTIFLDEVGDMPLALQAKVLRVLQERTIQRVGGTAEIPVDIKLIAATNRDLERMVAEGLFRMDLFYRLNVINIRIPPLRERLDDLEDLVAAIIARLNGVCGTHVTHVHPDVLQAFRDYDWPGNVRELENVLERALNFVDGDEVDLDHLPPYIAEARRGRSGPGPLSRSGSASGWGPASESGSGGPLPRAPLVRPWGGDRGCGAQPSLRTVLKNEEREAVPRALEACGNNRTEAAKLLGISRSGLYKKLREHGIQPRRPRGRSR
ncbi:MAG: sigma 54-interacting transcriptional regulator [Bacillota bacterium]|nr:sigma 54-interacting transcriptional regulator [Bacillota bacterium]